MKVSRALARLDSVVVPRLALGADRIAGTVRRSWRRPVPVAVALALLAGVVILVAQVSARPGVAILPDPTVRVGVSDGDWIPQYLSASRERLDRLVGAAPTSEVYALVSLKRYLTPTEVAGLVTRTVATTAGDTSGRLTTISAKARVPLARRQTSLVDLAADRLPDDLVASMALAAERKSAQAADYAARASAAPPESRLPLATSAEVASAEAAAYRERCACIFALVVRALPGVLLRLAEHEDVRTVDPAPLVLDVRRAVFVAPLPEQTDVVRPPADGP